MLPCCSYKLRLAVRISYCSILLVIIGCSSSKDDLSKWEKLAFPAGQSIRSLQFTGGSHGFVITAGNALYETRDGGKTFSEINLNSQRELEDICFLNGDVGFVLGHKGYLSRTSDGGRSWSQINADSSYDFRRMKFLDNEHGYLIGTVSMQGDSFRGLIGLSADRGLSWQFDTTGFHGFHQIETVYPRHVWVLGTDAVMYTTDRGATWDHSVMRGADVIRCLSFSDVAHGWSVGNHGLVKISSDGGWSWQAQNKITERDLSCVISPDINELFLAGDRIVAASTNHGRHWSVDSLSHAVKFTCMQKAGGDIILGGEQGTILRLKR